MRNSIRVGPLHTCASAVLTTAHKAYKTIEALPSPLGSLSHNVAHFIGPILLPLHYHWLTILSLMDDQILTIEHVMETVVPPLGYAFDRIDNLVCLFETLPTSYDNAVNKFMVTKQKIGYMNWALAQLFFVSNFFITILADWGVHGAEEKEMIESHTPITRDSSESSFKGLMDNNKEHMNQTYKDILIKKVLKNEENIEKGKKFESEMTYKMILEMGIKKEEDKTTNEDEQPNYEKIVKSEKLKENEETEKDIVVKEENILKSGRKLIIGNNVGKIGREIDEETYFNPSSLKDSRFGSKKKSRRKRMLVKMYV